jgi:hypothetical protein
MSPAAFLGTARAAGVTLWAEGGILRYRGRIAGDLGAESRIQVV